MSCYFAHKNEIRDNQITLLGDEAYHCAKSARRSVGEEVTVIDGEGTGYLVVLDSVTSKRVQATVLETMLHWNEPAVRVTLVAALIRATRYEIAIEKAVELGVWQIVPVLSNHTVIKPPSKEKLSRWQNISISAAKQCRRGQIPQVCTVGHLKETVEALPKNEILVVAHPYGSDGSLDKVPRDGRNITVVVGPEGGLHEDEVTFCLERGAYLLDLGPRRLRAETAAVTAIGLLMKHLGEI